MISIVTEEMFRNHYYTFGGKLYHQEEVGPIGLRDTCAVARICMHVIDRKWKTKRNILKVICSLIKRNMDDSRTLLPPIRAGWR